MPASFIVCTAGIVGNIRIWATESACGEDGDARPRTDPLQFCVLHEETGGQGAFFQKLHEGKRRVQGREEGSREHA